MYTKVDHWVAGYLARHSKAWTFMFGWLLRLAHVLGWHHLAIYTPDDEVEGITFGTKQYIDEVVDAHGQVYGDVDPEPPDGAA